MSVGKSLFSKIFFAHIIAILLFAVLSLVLSLGVIKTYFVNQEAYELKNSALTTIAAIKPIILNKKLQSAKSVIKKIAENINTRITLIDTEGKVVTDSSKNENSIDNFKDAPEVISALIGKTGKKERFDSILKQRILYVAVPIRKGGKIIGALRLSHSLDPIRFVIDEFEAKIVQIALVALSFSLLFSFLFSKNIASDLKRLAYGARKIASGRFDMRIKTRNSGEIKILSDSFNHMADQIKRLFGEVYRANRELSTIIKTIPDPMAVIKEGKIETTNSSFLLLVEDSNAVGKYYWELTGGRNINKAIEAKKKNIELKIGENFYNCTTAELPENKMMIMFHDITSIKNLEQVKNDFVANVSHELRTPLAAIKGFAETLEEEEENPAKLHYLQIINKHADRLANIVSDLLTLSSLEDKNASLSVEPVDLKTEIENILKLFESKAKEKKIAIISYVADMPLVYLDSYKFEQLMINLIDNAIKYTERGTVSVSAALKDSNMLNIVVEDTGIGISDDEKERIFERFYRVDKSRSKAEGGTGLGLSIVKHIVLLFGGAIELKSKTGKGTKFILKLPDQRELLG